MMIMAAVSTGYVLLSWALIGFKTEQVYLVLGFNGLYFSSLSTRRFITGFSIFIAFWIIFDYMKAFPNYLYNTVHIETLYHAEKNAFGINVKGNILTPNEYWLQHRSTFLDILSGVFYLCWVPVPLAFAVYLFYKKRTAFLQFSLSFLMVNLVGFVIYYAYPAAPPWYVQQHGFGFIPGTPGNSAGLENFDRFFHAGIFQSLYSKSSNVFAAVPSLHAAYMLVVLFYGLKYRMGWVNILFAAIMAGIWFSAIYSSHHYVLDVLAGIACAIFGIALFQWLLLKSRFFNKAVDQFDRAIA
jgi:membrane-associated phospholipid phosphatase